MLNGRKIMIIILFLSLFVIPIAQLEAMSDKNSLKDIKSEITSTADIIRWYGYEPKIFTLEGMLIVAVSYGPPNYGESPEKDEKVNYYVLKLNNPINIKGDPKSELNNSTFKNVTEIQVVLRNGYTANIKNIINKKVMIKGALFQKHTGHHYTDVLINAQAIDLKKTWGR